MVTRKIKLVVFDLVVEHKETGKVRIVKDNKIFSNSKKDAFNSDNYDLSSEETAFPVNIRKESVDYQMSEEDFYNHAKPVNKENESEE